MHLIFSFQGTKQTGKCKCGAINCTFYGGSRFHFLGLNKSLFNLLIKDYSGDTPWTKCEKQIAENNVSRQCHFEQFRCPNIYSFSIPDYLTLKLRIPVEIISERNCFTYRNESVEVAVLLRWQKHQTS